MKKLKHNFKKGMAFVLSLAMVAGLVPAMSGGANKVQAAPGLGTEPSVSAYATKEQLMDGTFAPKADGTAENYGKIVFGKNSSGNPQEWYILGKDGGVSGGDNNTIIFAASPIETGQKFSSSESNKTYNYEAGTGYGDSEGSKEVFANHYGASDLRVVLKGMTDSSNTTYFTSAEQGLMNATTVTTKDTKIDNTYTTTDKLYALAADDYKSTTIKAGTNNQTVLAMSKYWSRGDGFWLRSPRASNYSSAMIANPGHYVLYSNVTFGRAVQPASNLNLSSVLFASSAKAASSDTVESGVIASGTAMTLRLNGTGKNIGTVTYNTTTGDIKAVKGSTTQTVALVVQGNDGANDWYYSKKITGTEVVNVTDIASATYTPASIDLSTCKIWLEITDTDGMIYAVNADKEIEPINTTYVTKEQLMSSFKPYSDGTAVNTGKLVFGKKSDGTTAQQWYILGKDEGVSGDNTIIFAASPIATGQVFNSDTSDKTYDSTTVNANHYGASELRVTLQRMLEDESGNAVETYFTTAEQGLMNPTTVTTKDTKNSATYTTTDKLYALAADGSGSSYKTIKAGTSDSTVLAMDSYWSSGAGFWLRSPLDDYGGSFALLASPGDYVDDGYVIGGRAVQPASNLNLSSVLFASSAKAASSDTAVSGTIASETAMTLRLDGSDTAIGMAHYDAAKGVIVADRAANAAETISLVVQGNDGTNDWYYSVPLGETTVVFASQIKDSITSLSTVPDLADCNIWLETTIDNVAYAKKADTFTVNLVNSVAVTGMKPVGGTAFNGTASCSDTGITNTAPAITYTTTGDSGEVEVTGNADWNKTYKAKVKLSTGTVGDDVYVFGNSVTVTVDGETLTNAVTPNTDGTLTVTREFTTAKRKIVSIAPAVPTDNTFTTYYGFEGYDASPISGSNTELGTQATVIFEGTMAPTTADMDVTWTIANDGEAAYDRTPGAENIFRWTIPASEFQNYDASACQGYDAATGDITGTVTITNKAATPVNITGTDKGMAYTGEAIDVSKYFAIDTNAGTAAYSLVTGADGGTGEGSLNGTTLTVTKTGTFKIKVTTLANGIYAAGEKNITLTIANGTIQYTATDYSGTYDGQAHNISVNVTNPSGTKVTYSTDGVTYGNDNPSFTEAGTYTVYYRITKDNYDTINASKTVTINKKPVTITSENQSIVWGDDIDESKYTKDGLLTGDSITEITLTPSTSAFTEKGTISISGVKIVNAAGKDVTGNYDITPINGTLKIAHNTALAPDRIEAVKTKTTYTAGESLNVDDITVKAYYADGYSEEVTDFTTNATAIDMSKMGDKTLTVSYTKNGGTKTKDITITVSKKDTNAPYIKGDNGKEGWDVILGEVNKAQNKDKVIVDMNGASIVPGNVLDEIKGKDITIVFDMGNGITWSINGQSITTGNVGNIDFTVKTGTKSIPVDIINNVTGERNNIQISLNHSGDFGFTAILSVNVDKKNAGLYANLFYYNETTGKMEFICADKIADDGIAELNFTHASDYAIVIDTEPMDGNAPDTGDKTPVAPLLALIIGTGLMAVAFLKKKKFIVKD